LSHPFSRSKTHEDIDLHMLLQTSAASFDRACQKGSLCLSLLLEVARSSGVQMDRREICRRSVSDLDDHLASDFTAVLSQDSEADMRQEEEQAQAVERWQSDGGDEAVGVAARFTRSTT